MTQQTITSEDVKNFLQNLLLEEKKIDLKGVDLNTNLKELNIDSFSFLEVIFSIEHHYNIFFPQNFEDIKTLQDVINVTYELIQQKNKTA
jgi:acyl carrier protein